MRFTTSAKILSLWAQTVLASAVNEGVAELGVCLEDDPACTTSSETERVQGRDSIASLVHTSFLQHQGATILSANDSSLTTPNQSSQRRGIDILGLYTYGCPATAHPQLRNKKAHDGCFPGLRVFNARQAENMWGGLDVIHDPVPFVAYVASHEHALMSTLKSRLWDPENPEYRECDKTLNQYPPSDGELWVAGHLGDGYIAGLRPAADKYEMAALMAHFVAIAYNDDPGEVAAAFKVNGWNMIGRAQADESDISYLVQHPETLDCTMVFRGTDDASDAMADINAIGTDFCGFDASVHEGFANQLRRMVSCDDFKKNIHPLLGKCKGVYVTGHSLGGATAELFTACANFAPAAGTKGYEDYKLIGWKPDYTPSLQPEGLVTQSRDPIEKKIKCELDTGGTCTFADCDAGRLEVQCSSGTCMCKEGFCSVAGVCMDQKYLDLAINPPCGDGYAMELKDLSGPGKVWHTDVESSEGCKILCDETTDCMAFEFAWDGFELGKCATYSGDYPKEDLKQGHPQYYGWVSCTRARPACPSGYDIVENDLSGGGKVWHTASNVASCKSFCESIADCNAIEFAWDGKERTKCATYTATKTDLDTGHLQHEGWMSCARVPACPSGYEKQTHDLGGGGKEWSYAQSADGCASTCQTRGGCTAFEYAWDGEEMTKCATYTADKESLDAGRDQKLGWLSCTKN